MTKNSGNKRGETGLKKPTKKLKIEKKNEEKNDTEFKEKNGKWENGENLKDTQYGQIKSQKIEKKNGLEK